MADTVLRAIITGNATSAVAAFGESAAAAESSASRHGNAFNGISRAFEAATAAAIGGAATVGVAAVTMAVNYETASDRMAAMAGITQQQATAIGDAFLSTAGRTTFSAKEIMEAYGPVSGQFGLTEGHALSAAEALNMMSAAANLAEASGSDLTTTTAALAGVMQAFQMDVSQSSMATDELFNSSRALGIPVTDLANTIERFRKNLGPLAPDLAQTSTFMIDLEKHGIEGSRALAGATTSVTHLLSNTKPVNDELAKLGVNLFDASGHFVGLGSVIDQLQPKLAGMTQEQQIAVDTALFGSKGYELLNTTLLAGTAAWNQAAAAATAAGTAQQGAATATDNVKGEWEKLTKSALPDMLVQLGQILLPGVTKALTDVTNWIATHKDVIQKDAAIAFHDFGIAAHDAGDFIKNDLWPPVHAVVGFLVDHPTVVKDAAVALAGLYAANKVGHAAGSVIGDLKSLFAVGGQIEQGIAKLRGLSSGGAAPSMGRRPTNPFGDALDATKGIKVWGGPVEVIGKGFGFSGSGGANKGMPPSNILPGLAAGNATAPAAASATPAVFSGAMGVATTALVVAAPLAMVASQAWNMATVLQNMHGDLTAGEDAIKRAIGPTNLTADQWQKLFHDIENGRIQGKQAIDNEIKNLELANDATHTNAQTWGNILEDAQSLQRFGAGWQAHVKDDLSQVLVHGSDLAAATGDLASLMAQGKITTGDQVKQYTQDWNQIQAKASDAAGAQQEFASMLESGQLSLDTDMNQFIAAWNASKEHGDSLQQEMWAMANLSAHAADHTTDLASYLSSLASAVGISVTAIIGDYVQTAGFAARMVLAQQSVTGTVQALSAAGIGHAQAYAGGSAGYAEGGIASGPASGYLALLHGTEAIIPTKYLGAAPRDGGAPSVTNYVTIQVTGADPQAVVDALRRYMYSTGSVPINVQSANMVAA